MAVCSFLPTAFPLPSLATTNTLPAPSAPHCLPPLDLLSWAGALPGELRPAATDGTAAPPEVAPGKDKKGGERKQQALRRIFFHSSEVADNVLLSVGDEVEFAVVFNPKSKELNARYVVRTKVTPPPLLLTPSSTNCVSTLFPLQFGSPPSLQSASLLLCLLPSPCFDCVGMLCKWGLVQRQKTWAQAHPHSLLMPIAMHIPQSLPNTWNLASMYFQLHIP